jgi:hypothetical protein
VDLLLRHEEGAVAQHRLQAARGISLRAAGEHVVIQGPSGAGVETRQNAGAVVDDDEIVERQPGAGGGREVRVVPPDRAARVAVKGLRPGRVLVADRHDDDARREQRVPARQWRLEDLLRPVAAARPGVDVLELPAAGCAADGEGGFLIDGQGACERQSAEVPPDGVAGDQIEGEQSAVTARDEQQLAHAPQAIASGT